MATTKLYVVGALAVALAFAGVSGLALWFRGQALAAAAERDSARSSLATAQAANDAQKAAIERLTAGRAMDDKLLVELQSKLGELAKQTQQATSAIRDLERSNENVKAYLASRLPDELRRLLEHGTDGKPANGDR